MLYGAIIGDIVGSIYEFHNIKTKDFPFFPMHGYITDDSCMTIAVADAVNRWKKHGGDLSEMAAESMRKIGIAFPHMGYGTQFANWLVRKDMGPYNSWGNGAAMRISASGWYGDSITEVKRLSYMVTSVSHDHIEGIKGAEATAVAIFLARMGKTKEEIARYITTNYYDWCASVAELQANYSWDGSCQGTVPPAMQCFFESDSFEDAIRNAISIGGDSDTIGAITGSVAEAYYGINSDMIKKAQPYIPEELLQMVTELEKAISNKEG